MFPRWGCELPARDELAQAGRVNLVAVCSEDVQRDDLPPKRSQQMTSSVRARSPQSKPGADTNQGSHPRGEAATGERGDALSRTRVRTTS
jgi:hypothetical protein